MATDERHRRYWQANIKLLSILLGIWFLFGCVLSIFLVEPLNNFKLAGFPLGFWISQQGTIVVFIVLILVYALKMQKIDKEFGNDPTKPDVPAAAEKKEDAE